MSGYKAPPLPAVGDRVHSIGPFPLPGEVRAVMPEMRNEDGTPWHVIVVRYWLKRKRVFRWVCIEEDEWRMGLLRPGPVPDRLPDGRWPWESEP